MKALLGENLLLTLIEIKGKNNSYKVLKTLQNSQNARSGVIAFSTSAQDWLKSATINA